MTQAQVEGMRKQAPALEGDWQVIDRRGYCIMFDLSEERARRYARLYKGATVRRVPRPAAEVAR